MPRSGLVIGQINRIGGMEKQAALLSRELEKRGMEVTLFISGIARSGGGAESLDLGSISMKSLYHSRYSGFLGRRLLRRHCRRLGISRLIAFNAENAEIAVGARIDGAVALNVRGTKFSTDPRLAERYRKAAAKCERLITNSANTALLIQKLGIAEESRITIIHNGIELPSIELSPRSKTILYVGSIKKVKDPMTFVKACRDVVGGDEEVRIVMAGDGDMKPLVERYIREHRLDGNFRLLGEVPYGEIPYREASVFVNSSLRESSCNSLLEALSFGIPVVAADNPGNRDILSGLAHHRLVPVSDSTEMAAAIRFLLNAGPGLRKTIFEESRELIREHYSVSKMVDEYLDSFLNA